MTTSCAAQAGKKSPSRRYGIVLSAMLVAAVTSTNAIASAERTPHGRALVGPGTYRPLYPASPDERSVPVERFWLDVRPVTNEEYLGFVIAHPEWRRDQVKRLFADAGYLSHWNDVLTLGSAVRGRQPVTQVSWFAAKAYCAAHGARLPTEREWELAASAGETSANPDVDPVRAARLLAWYAEPSASSALPLAASGKANFWGVYDLHGVVWEWVYDFGASLVVSDSREKDRGGDNRFCGGAGADAQNPSDYAAFMRIAFRSSLEARYTTSRLGFRCARTVEGSP